MKSYFVVLLITVAFTEALISFSTVDAATHIVALSDETIGGGYVATDRKIYAPSDKVAASTVAKKVGLYPIFDKGDVIV